MARRFKTIKLEIEYQIYEDEKEILDKYGFAYKRNAEEQAKKQAKNVAYELRMIEEKTKDDT